MMRHVTRDPSLHLTFSTTRLYGKENSELRKIILSHFLNVRTESRISATRNELSTGNSTVESS